jgi:hypothetical protein
MKRMATAEDAELEFYGIACFGALRKTFLVHV